MCNESNVIAVAVGRGRGLGSTVIHRLEEQVACSEAFERVVGEQGWVLCRNEGRVEEAVRGVVAEIDKVL